MHRVKDGGVPGSGSRNAAGRFLGSQRVGRPRLREARRRSVVLDGRDGVDCPGFAVFAPLGWCARDTIWPAVTTKRAPPQQGWPPRRARQTKPWKADTLCRLAALIAENCRLCSLTCRALLPALDTESPQSCSPFAFTCIR